MPIKQRRLGLALGGGGARGLAHIGVLKELERNKITPDKIAGTSMGAVIGALYAVGYTAEDIEKEVNKNNRKRDIAKFLDLSYSKNAIIKGERIKKYIDKLLANKNFSDTNIPLSITATDLGSGRLITIKKGNIATALRASISVPGIFAPVKYEGKYLIDGGVVEPTPITAFNKTNIDIIIAVDLIMRSNKRLSANPSLISTIMHSYDIIRTQAVKDRIIKQPHKLIIITPQIRDAIDSFKFSNISSFIKAGEEAAKKSLPKILKAIQ